MVGKVQDSQRELEQKARERQLAEEKNRELAAIIKSSRDSIISNSPEGIITSWNDGARMMYGYTPQ